MTVYESMTSADAMRKLILVLDRSMHRVSDFFREWDTIVGHKTSQIVDLPERERTRTQMDEFGQRAPTPILCGCDVRRPWAGSYADRAPVMATCRSWLAGVSDASLAGQGRMRHASAALFGALGLLISIRSSVSASQPCEDDSQGPWCSTERATLAVSGLLSWYVAATPVPRLNPASHSPVRPLCHI